MAGAQLEAPARQRPGRLLILGQALSLLLASSCLGPLHPPLVLHVEKLKLWGVPRASHTPGQCCPLGRASAQGHRLNTCMSSMC